MKALTRMSAFCASGALLLAVAAAAAGTDGWVKIPQGTRVPLELVSGLSTKTAVRGRQVDLRVAEDVWVGTSLLVRKGEKTKAVVGEVTQPGSFGKSGGLSLDFGNVRAVDGTLVDLGVWSRDQKEGRGYAAGASIGGAAVLGPIGLVGGLFVKGSHVELPAGHRIDAAVRWDAVVSTSPASPSLVAQKPVVPAAAGAAQVKPTPTDAPTTAAGKPEQGPSAAAGDTRKEPVAEAASKPADKPAEKPPSTSKPAPAKPESTGKPVPPVIPIIEDITGQ